MQALFFTGRPEKGLEWQETPEPELLAPTDAIVAPIAIAACDLDRKIVQRSPFPGPFALGHEFTARVVEVGAEVAGICPGDTVLASFQPSCGSCSACGHGKSSACHQVTNGAMYGLGEAGGGWSGAMTDRVRIPWAAFNLAVLPAELDPVALASGSDNLADGLRCVDGPLARRGEARVLIAGSGSIALYAVACARFLGASEVTFASKDAFALRTAESLGAECLPVQTWPSRFRNHDVTVDCTADPDGLAAVLRSTTAWGDCTSASIYFEETIPVPMFNLNMKGIHFTTGRVDSASSLGRVIGLVGRGLDPGGIDPAIYPLERAVEAFEKEPYSRKIILTRTD